jgi:hypothetical protein
MSVTLYSRILEVLSSDLGRDPDNSHSVDCSILIKLSIMDAESLDTESVVKL